jgi:hypothetical protein
MMNNPLVLFTNRGLVVTRFGHLGPFANSDLAVVGAEAHYKKLRAERSTQGVNGINGFVLIPAESYVFTSAGKAIANPLQP